MIKVGPSFPHVMAARTAEITPATEHSTIHSVEPAMIAMISPMALSPRMIGDSRHTTMKMMTPRTMSSQSMLVTVGPFCYFCYAGRVLPEWALRSWEPLTSADALSLPRFLFTITCLK